MLNPQVVVNLLPKLGVGVDLVKHAIDLVKDFKCAAEGFSQSLGGIVDQRWRRESAPTAKRKYSKRRHAAACGVRDAGPTGRLRSAGVAATRPAVRFA